MEVTQVAHKEAYTPRRDGLPRVVHGPGGSTEPITRCANADCRLPTHGSRLVDGYCRACQNAVALAVAQAVAVAVRS